MGGDGHRLNILEVQRLIRFMPKSSSRCSGWAVGGGHSLHVYDM
jgi:naphthoate synthase